MDAATTFLREHGEALAHNLGHDVMRAAEEIVRTVGAAGQLPPGVDAIAAFRVILSLRATLDLMAVEHRFGSPAHDALLDAMLAHYGRTILRSGSFATWIATAHESMRRSENPRDWMRIHAEQLLGTHEPEASVFHLALGYGLQAGASIATVVEANVGTPRSDAHQ